MKAERTKVIRQHFSTAALILAVVILATPTTSNADILYVSAGNTIEKFDTGIGADLGVFARTSSPKGLAFDSAGNLYAAISGGFSIEKITPDGVRSTFASTGLSTPYGLTFDSAGNLYAANFSNNKIEKFSSTGADLGLFANTGLLDIAGLVCDSAGNLYVAGLSLQGGGAIKKYDTVTGADLGVFANLGASTTPMGLAFDSVGNLFVSIWGAGGQTIEKITPQGVGSVFASGLSTPWGLAFDSAGNLYATYYSNNTIEKFSSTGTYLGVFAKTGYFDHPSFIAIQVPEPTTAPLVGMGGLLLWAGFRRKQHLSKSFD